MIFTVNPEKEEHFYQLLENLKAKEPTSSSNYSSMLKTEKSERDNCPAA